MLRQDSTWIPGPFMMAVWRSSTTVLFLTVLYSSAAESKLEYDESPTLLELQHFPVTDRFEDIVAEIQNDYEHFGIQLLKDSKGVRIKGIEQAKLGHPVAITLEILRQWLQGKGRTPVTWRTFVECLRESRLNVPAEYIEAALGRRNIPVTATSSYMYLRQTVSDSRLPEYSGDVGLPPVWISSSVGLIIGVVIGILVMVVVLKREKFKATKERAKEMTVMRSDYNPPISPILSLLQIYNLFINLRAKALHAAMQLSVKDFQDFLAGIPVFTTEEKPNFFNRTTVSRFTTMTELFHYLDDFWDYINCDLLQRVVMKIGNDELSDAMEDYCTKLMQTRGETTVQQFVFQVDNHPQLKIVRSRKFFTEVLIRLRAQSNEYTLQDAERLRQDFLATNSLTSYSVALCDVSEGTIVIKLWLRSECSPTIIDCEKLPNFVSKSPVLEVLVDGVPIQFSHSEVTKIEINPSPSSPSEPHQGIRLPTPAASTRAWSQPTMTGGSCWPCYVFIAAAVLAVVAVLYVNNGIPDVVPISSKSGDPVPVSSKPGDPVPVSSKPGDTITTAAGGCHRIDISKKQELEKAVAEIGDWDSLCENLGAPKPVINELRSSSTENGKKKSRCLEAYLNTDKACWERVVEVVADYPFYNKRLARQIADNHYSSRKEL